MSLPSSLSLGGRVALVTGASRGIGHSIALELAERGAAVAANYNQSAVSAEQVVAQIREKGGQAVAIQADVSNNQEAQTLIKTTIETLG